MEIDEKRHSTSAVQLMDVRVNSFGSFLALSFVGAFVTGITFLLALHLSLGPDDDGYGQSVFAVLNDPFVRAVFLPVTLLSGLVASPITFLCLRRRRLAIAAPIVFGSVLGTVALVTPFSPGLGWLSSYAALILACLACARLPAAKLEIQNTPR